MYTMLTSLLVAATLAGVNASGDDHGSEGSLPWEFHAVFDFHSKAEAGPMSLYFTMNKDNKYADKSNNLLFLKTTSATYGGLGAAEDAAKHAWENASTFVTALPSTTITAGTVYTMQFDTTAPVTAYKVDIAEDGAYAMFSQHFIYEFENLAGHYLKSKDGKDIEPTFAEGTLPVVVAPTPELTVVANKEDAPLQAIGASIIVTLLGAIGLIVVYPCWKASNMHKNILTWVNDIAQMFAAGALMSTTFLLILPEAFHALKKAHPFDDVLQSVGVGASCMAGIVLSMIISMMCALIQDNAPATNTSTVTATTGKKNQQGIEMTDGQKMEEVVSMEDGKPAPVSIVLHEDDPTNYNKPFCQCRPKRWTSAAWTVLVGDFFHNVADGVAIGVAFRTCDPAFGWVVAIGAIGHEVSQEVADFILLVTRGNMSVGAGVIANLLSGTSCILGAAIAVNVEMSDEAVGCLLAFSGGVYIWAAACECMAPLVETSTSLKRIAVRVLCFAIGAVCIGLVLLNHVHCEAPVATGPTPSGTVAVDPHAGHNH